MSEGLKLLCIRWEKIFQPAPSPQGRRASKTGAERNMLGIPAKQIPQGTAVRKPLLAESTGTKARV